MVNIFELFEHEVACDMAWVESAVATAKYEMISDPDVFMEAGGSGNIFQKLIAKVKEIVEKAINTIRQFFASKQVESNMKKAEAVAKANPGLLKKKVKVKDYEKLDKINKKAQADLKKCKTKAQVDDVMDKYRKQRNIAIGAGAVAVVTLGAVCAYSIKKGKDAQSALNKVSDEYESTIFNLQKELDVSMDQTDRAIGLNKELGKLLNESEASVTKLAERNQKLEGELAAAKAASELVADASKDAISQNREFAINCMKLGATIEKYNNANKDYKKIRGAWEDGKRNNLPAGSFPSAREMARAQNKAMDLEDSVATRFDKIKGTAGL